MRPPSVEKRTANQAATDATDEAPGPSAMAEKVIAADSAASAWLAPMKTMNQPTAFPGRRNDQDGTGRREGDAHDPETHQREVREAERVLNDRHRVGDPPGDGKRQQLPP